jgi:DGQHR domain-containing protein
LEVLNGLGMDALGGLPQVNLRSLDPEGGHGRDDHFEFDYLIACGTLCLVGEITSRNANHVAAKFTRFRRHLNILSHIDHSDDAWQSLGVPRARLRDFREVSEFRGFFIATSVEEFDKRLGGSHTQNIALFYRPDWRILASYSQTLSLYGRPHIASKLGVPPETPPIALRITRNNDSLIAARHRRVATGSVGLADVYTFEVSPYNLLPIAQVFRRDLLPDLSPRSGKDYQRPLLGEKLRNIRTKLQNTEDFVFPSNILVTLSADSHYDRRNGVLVIPGRYGAIEVIDGQHRLFSYASEAIESERGADARIMVTAIQFSEGDEEDIAEYSAKTFVEINTNQSRIAASHLDAIAFGVLGEKTPRALAAAVLYRLNSKDSAAKGLFKTSQTNLGVVSSDTVARAIRALVSLQALGDLPQGSARLRGYNELLGAAPRTPVSLIDRAVAALGQFFNRVASTFPRDWPSRDEERASALEYAKVFAGLVMLFDQFVTEGLTWLQVQRELTAIRRNLLILRALPPTYQDVVLDDDADGQIPDSGPTANDDFKFFQANRNTPTPINQVVVQRRRPQRQRGRRRRRADA